MQLGLMSTQEVLQSGISRFALYRRVKSEKWQELFPGIFLPSPLPPTRDQLLLGACKWSGGVISHRAAASRYGLMKTELIELTTPRYVRSARDDVVIHRVASLEPRNLTRIGVIPVTTPISTLIDLGGVSDRTTLRAAAYEALRLGLTTVDRIERALEQPARGRRGMGELRTVMKQCLDTHLEYLLRLVLKRSNLPRFASQHRVDLRGGRYYVVDFAYPNERVAIEADGWAVHSDREAFENDRRRLRELGVLGWIVLCFTYDDITLRPDEVVATIAAALKSRTARGA